MLALQTVDTIKLNELLNLKDISNTKIRLVIMSKHNWNPLEFYNSIELNDLLGSLYNNYTRKAYKVGETAIGLVRIGQAKDNLWLLYHIGIVTKDLELFGKDHAYEYTAITKYKKYFGRVIIKIRRRH